VTIPPPVRKAVGLSVGDMLEASGEGTKVVMKRRAIVGPAHGGRSDRAAEAAHRLGYVSVQALEWPSRRPSVETPSTALDDETWPKR